MSRPTDGHVARASVSPVTLGRLLMALTTWLILIVDPVPPVVTAPVPIVVLTMYVWFAVLVLVLERRNGHYPRALDWLELGLCLTLTAVTGGFDSVLFWVLLLPIIARSIRQGFTAAAWLALVGIGAYVALSMALLARPYAAVEAYRMFRPLLLLVLGYVIARSGAEQRRVRQQLALLASLTLIGNPRLGVDRTLANAVGRIRECFGSRECLLLLADGSEDCLMVRADGRSTALDRLPKSSLQPVFTGLGQRRVLHAPGWRRRLLRRPEDRALEPVSDLIDARAWITVPLTAPGAAGGDAEPTGRLFLLGRRLPEIDAADLDFLSDVAAQLMQMIDKIRIVDELAGVIADRERRRLAVDLHDRAIQPYLGIQLGLMAAMRRPGVSAEMYADLAGLLEHSRHGVGELRAILAGQRVARTDPELLVQDVAELGARMQRLFGLQVSFELPPVLRIRGRLVDDVLGLIQEALSNIVRHTTAHTAKVTLLAGADQMIIEIRNPAGYPPPVPFQPRSLSERSARLGGRVEVEVDPYAETCVRISIPL